VFAGRLGDRGCCHQRRNLAPDVASELAARAEQGCEGTGRGRVSRERDRADVVLGRTRPGARRIDEGVSSAVRLVRSSGRQVAGRDVDAGHASNLAVRSSLVPRMR
jgi:hypothetical protein